jgi:hypothetical protein
MRLSIREFRHGGAVRCSTVTFVLELVFGFLHLGVAPSVSCTMYLSVPGPGDGSAHTPSPLNLHRPVAPNAVSASRRLGHGQGDLGWPEPEQSQSRARAEPEQSQSHSPLAADSTGDHGAQEGRSEREGGTCRQAGRQLVSCSAAQSLYTWPVNRIESNQINLTD